MKVVYTEKVLPTPVKDGFAFAGWYLDKECTKSIADNKATNLCTIYENRPDFCRIYKWYEIQFSQYMSLDKFLSGQKLGCKVLQKISKRRNNK